MTGPTSSRARSTKRAARRTTTRLAALVALALTAAACADDKPLNTFEPRSPQARTIDNLMGPIWWVMGVIFVLVVFGTMIISWRNRVKESDYDPEDLPEQVHGNTPLELAWTIAPALLLAVITIPTVGAIWDLEERNDECGVGDVGPGCDGLDVMVIGQQWWWEYRYDVDGDGFFLDVDGDGEAGDADDREWPLELSLDPDDVVTATELVIPAGQQVDLLLTSRDVIHSFWIPRLNGKRDTVPGRWHTWTIAADDPGKYTGWCTEFCGLSHARMRMSAIALDPDDFDAWLANQSELADIPGDDDPDAVAGRELFLNNCQRCHMIDDGEIPAPEDIALVSRAAPNLTHFATRSTFAGGIYSVYAGGPGDATDANDDALPAGDYLNLAELASDPDSLDDYRLNAAELKRWIANAPEQKDMAPDPNEETGLGRGMPAFTDLSDEQLDQIVAYLATLD
ncbi:MAG: cytochrome c oxidase subunit II [Actinomycetota bacterium]